ncbi:MAG TPA: DMT family transporter [Candidatus Sabulitectum sp.]|nr:DMT family transporter [Candidatus Sabulitectum sp.]HPF31843.1 DMT family transporter [Candidatus Sabulitectum sp.]HPJ28736.1 DMT family transporter [Candidatus Sabulitectum sp.]HPR22401.1 DMT family transporter [Candidatus Sabulitectum sp.]HRW78259.1 DMT family transporter [Candidatus Sabulitectum sp.]
MVTYFVTLFLFASMEVFSKPLMGTVDPMVLTFWRFACGLAVVGSFMAARRKPLPDRRSLLILAVMGLLNTFLSMALLQLAVKHTQAARAAAVFCFNPVTVVVIAWALGWEKLGRRRIAGLVTGLAGLILVTGAHTMTVDKGTVYALLAAVAFSIYTILGRKASLKADPFTVNTVSFAFGLAGLAVWLLLNGVSLSPAPLGPHLTVFLYLGAGVSGVGYVAYISTIKNMGAGNASTMFLMKPAVATVLAVAIIDEAPTLHFAAGLLLSAAGSWHVSRRG